MSDDLLEPWTDSIAAEVQKQHRFYSIRNELPAYLNQFAGRYLFGNPQQVNGMLRAIQHTPKEFWCDAEKTCLDAGGGRDEMERLLYELMLAGRTIVKRTSSEKRKASEKISSSIRSLLHDLHNDPLAAELTVPILAKTRASEALNELQNSLDYVEPTSTVYFDENDERVDDVEEAIANGINLTPELCASERESFITGLICGPNLADLLQGALSAYERELHGDSVLGPHREHTATAIHPKNLKDRRVYFYTRVISWFRNLSNDHRLNKDLISRTLDAILIDENPDLFDSGDAWENARRRVNNAQKNNNR